MESANRQSPFSLDFCGQDAPRSGVATLILASGTFWLAASTLLFAQGAASYFVVLSALGTFGTLLLALVTVASWSMHASWQRMGKLMLCFLIGVTASVWLTIIYGVGWLFLPLLLTECFALQFWPRGTGPSIRQGIGVMVTGFAILPLAILVHVVF